MQNAFPKEVSHPVPAFPRHRRSKDIFVLMEIMFAMWNISD